MEFQLFCSVLHVFEPTTSMKFSNFLGKYVCFRFSSHFCPPTPAFRSVKIQLFYKQLRVSSADLVTRHLHSPSPGLRVATKWSDTPSDPQLDIKNAPFGQTTANFRLWILLNRPSPTRKTAKQPPHQGSRNVVIAMGWPVTSPQASSIRPPTGAVLEWLSYKD